MGRDITVIFDDGTSNVYKNAPDNVSPIDVQTRAEKEFSKKVIEIDGGKNEPRSLGQEVMQKVGVATRGVNEALVPVVAGTMVGGALGGPVGAALGGLAGHHKLSHQ